MTTRQQSEAQLAGRRFGLRAIDAYEQPSEISNRAADEFRELRDEIVARRARGDQ